MKRKLLLLPVLLLAGCERKMCDCAPPLVTMLEGHYEWIKTSTPTSVKTPSNTGLQKDLNFYWKQDHFFVDLYENDSLVSGTAVSSESEDKKNLWLMVKSVNGDFMKYSFVASGQIEVSEFLKTYSDKADTVRHLYQYAGEPVKR